MDRNVTKNGQEFIEQFFAALGKSDFRQCENCLFYLQAVAEVEPHYLHWSRYLQGVLIYRRDPDYARSGKIWSQLLLLPLEPRLYAKVLLALGNFYQRQGDWLKSIETYQQSLPLFEQLGQPLEKIKALQNIGNAYGRGFDNGDLSLQIIHKGIEASEQAIKILTNFTENPKELCGPFYNTVGGLHFHLENWQQSVDYYLKFLEISQELNNRLNVGFVNGNLGEIYQKQGKLIPALDAYQTALEIFQEFDEIREIPEVLANLAALYEEMDQAEQALHHHEQAIIAVEECRAQLSTQENRMAYMSTAHHYYGNAILYCLSIGDKAQALHYAERARSREFLDMLDIAHGSDEGISIPLTLEQIQEKLPPDSLLLSYFTTGLYNHKLYRETQKRKVHRHRFPDSKIILFAVTKTTLDVYEPAIPAARLDGVDNGSRRIWKNLQDASYGDFLYDQLLGPVTDLFHSKKQLYIIPHGVLHPIPFLALIPDALSATVPPLAYGLSASILLQDERQTSPSDDLKPCLAVGYNGSAANSLALAEQEAERVATSMQGHCWRGKMPKKTNLFTQAREYQLLHFACHGEFNQSSPLNSILIIGPEETLAVSEVNEKFRLENCKLVVLSACESGRHQMLRGDELLGFIRAFLNVGTQCVIATLWQVNDYSTLILMERFYKNLQVAGNINAALVEAQYYLKNLTCVQIRVILDRWLDELPKKSEATTTIVKVRQTLEQEFVDDELVFADPYYWAPFVLFQSQSL